MILLRLSISTALYKITNPILRLTIFRPYFFGEVPVRSMTSTYTETTKSTFVCIVNLCNVINSVIMFVVLL